MKPHYADDWLTVYGGDVREVLPALAADSVDCIVTSPPYWGLRDYGTAAWTNGDADCDHIASYSAGRPGRETPGGRGGSFPHNDIPHKDICRKCGALRQDSQLGLERTPEEYVANMVGVFRELRRVLKPSGTCWLNLGDSYAGSGKGPEGNLNAGDSFRHLDGATKPYTGNGLKPKDLVGIPWRVAFALQADGWYLRSDIIWSKPNPMPESVTDRPTKSHEYLFLLTKAARYFFDADAVREASTYPDDNRKARARVDQKRMPTAMVAGIRPGSQTYAQRNIRSVWTIATRPYPGAHFAVFPPELPERCIKAGSPVLGVVLDPFAGSGTVGMVANRLSRRAILIDLNPEYLKQQMRRNAQTPLGLGA